MTQIIPIYVFAIIAIICIAWYAEINESSERNKLLSEKKETLTDKWVNRKKHEMESDSSMMSFRTYSFLLIFLPLLTGAITWSVFRNTTIALFCAVGSLAIPDLIRKMFAKKQKETFEIRYARALQSLAACLRSNMTIQQAVNDVAENKFIDENIRKGFRQMNSDIAVGMTVQQAFRRFADNTGSKDAGDVASAIAMQMDVGGSESKVIENVADNIRSRIMMRKEIKTMFAEVNVLLVTMDVLPVIIILIVYLIIPEALNVYTSSPLLMAVFIVLIVIMYIGSFVIRSQLHTAQRGGK